MAPIISSLPHVLHSRKRKSLSCGCLKGCTSDWEAQPPGLMAGVNSDFALAHAQPRAKVQPDLVSPAATPEFWHAAPGQARLSRPPGRAQYPQGRFDESRLAIPRLGVSGRCDPARKIWARWKAKQKSWRSTSDGFLFQFHEEQHENRPHTHSGWKLRQYCLSHRTSSWKRKSAHQHGQGREYAEGQSGFRVHGWFTPPFSFAPSLFTDHKWVLVAKFHLQLK